MSNGQHLAGWGVRREVDR